MNVAGFITVDLFFIISNVNVKIEFNYKVLEFMKFKMKNNTKFKKNHSIETTNSRNPQSTPIASL